MNTTVTDIRPIGLPNKRFIQSSMIISPLIFINSDKVEYCPDLTFDPDQVFNDFENIVFVEAVEQMQVIPAL